MGKNKLLAVSVTAAAHGAEPYRPTIESLQKYECPQWFRDAKFGIYLHWGPYSVVERGEWYTRKLYEEGGTDYEYHVKTYGHPSQFGYKDFIPMWKAEKFDPDSLLELFQRAGVKYFTPCAVHHDNFDLWNSKHHRWNAVNMGPKKDLIGMWREATLKAGLRFGVTTHLSRSYSWLNVANQTDTEGPKKGVPYTTADTQTDKLIDIVSKNGNLLLNIPIRADGTLDETATQILEDMGDWLRVNGEGIYGTRPWYVFGEGKTNEIPHFVVESPFTWRDVRYTTKGEFLYAFVLAWPPKNRSHVELAFLAPGNSRIGKISSVELLGHDGDLQWEHHPDGLRVTFPEKRPCDFAYCLKIHLSKK